MEWIIILGFVVVGLVFLLVEAVFIPGTTVVGVAGFILCSVGIYLGYAWLGETVGTSLLCLSAIAAGLGFYYSLKSSTWNRFALKNSIDSKVNEDSTLLIDVHIGDEGKAISDLRPMGKADFGNQLYNVYTLNKHLKAGSKIKVFRIEGTKIYVEEV